MTSNTRSPFDGDVRGSADHRELELPAKLGKYEVLECIGSGGMGRVYAAWDPILRRKVALKLLAARETPSRAASFFEDEVQMLAALSHPNVVTIYDFCRDAGRCFAVMELVQGRTLRNHLRSRPGTTDNYLWIASDIASGLSAAHRRGIIHCDVKPENIIIATDGRVKLLDFGLSLRNPVDGRLRDDDGASRRSRGRLVGTIAYMSPEQARGDAVDFSSDIFSFGIVLYEMVHGRHPFWRGTVTETLRSIVDECPADVSRASALARRCHEIAMKCLEKNKPDRYASMSLVAEELAALCR